MSIVRRNNVQVTGSGDNTLIFSHGFGCDQNMWRFVTPAFERDYRVVLFDHVGAGKSDLSQYKRPKYDSLQGYADDVIEIIDSTGVEPVTFIGHSVSAIIGALAAIQRPEKFKRLVMIGPSPCYINIDGYAGGFSRADIDGLLDLLENNHLGWSSTMAPVIMGNSDRPELTAELNESFCRTDPEIMNQFARVTFLSDNRDDLPSLNTPTLILQCSQDLIAPHHVGEFVHRHVARSHLVTLQATGHCPHLSAPEETSAAIKTYLERT
jgi:sigma-B regulation protein RsbQ